MVVVTRLRRILDWFRLIDIGPEQPASVTVLTIDVVAEAERILRDAG